MKERDEMKRWVKAIELAESDTFCWRLYEDQAGIKPFDVLVVRPALHGCIAYAYEHKVWRKKRHEPDRKEALGLLSAHQAFFLKKFKQAGGVSIVVVFCQCFGTTLEFKV